MTSIKSVTARYEDDIVLNRHPSLAKATLSHLPCRIRGMSSLSRTSTIVFAPHGAAAVVTVCTEGKSSLFTIGCLARKSMMGGTMGRKVIWQRKNCFNSWQTWGQLHSINYISNYIPISAYHFQFHISVLDYLSFYFHFDDG